MSVDGVGCARVKRVEPWQLAKNTNLKSKFSCFAKFLRTTTSFGKLLEMPIEYQTVGEGFPLFY